MTPNENELALVLSELEDRIKYNLIDSYFTDDDRHLYKKHLEFFAAGATHRQRLALFGNRVGKSLAAGCEVVWHMTGRYPKFWTGYRFTTCNSWFIVGDTQQTVVAILQNLLLGPVGDFGTGLIPKDCLDFETLKEAKKSGTGVGSFRVKHVNGTYSTAQFKSSDQGRRSFQGVACSVWADEEVNFEVYQECLTRTMTGGNILIATFTPLRGMTEMVKSFLNDGDVLSEGETGLSKYVVRAGWDDAPHLAKKDKEELLASIPPFQRDARSKGIPQLGAGAIYPISESSFVIDPFEIPKHWPKAYGFDVGRNTAATFIALDRDSGTIYTYSDMLVVEGMPSTHSQAIMARGKWLRGAIDTSARGRSQTDGENLFQIYQEMGLHIQNADKAVEAGLYEILELLMQGRLKVFNTCTNLIKEFRGYQRDEKGRIVKKNDHVMDSWRYAVFTRDKILRTEAEAKAATDPIEIDLPYNYSSDSWMSS